MGFYNRNRRWTHSPTPLCTCCQMQQLNVSLKGEYSSCSARGCQCHLPVTNRIIQIRAPLSVVSVSFAFVALDESPGRFGNKIGLCQSFQETHPWLVVFRNNRKYTLGVKKNTQVHFQCLKHKSSAILCHLMNEPTTMYKRNCNVSGRILVTHIPASGRSL